MGGGTGRIWEERRKERSVKRKGSSLREGHGVEMRDSEDASLSFWRGSGVATESSKVSASSRTKGSEDRDSAWSGTESETLLLVPLMKLFGDLNGEEDGIVEGL